MLGTAKGILSLLSLLICHLEARPPLQPWQDLAISLMTLYKWPLSFTFNYKFEHMSAFLKIIHQFELNLKLFKIELLSSAVFTRLFLLFCLNLCCFMVARFCAQICILASVILAKWLTVSFWNQEASWDLCFCHRTGPNPHTWQAFIPMK